MTRNMMWMGFLATVLIVVVLMTAAMREPSRQDAKLEHFRAIAVTEGTDLYAENCAVCHGAAGEGLGATPALANEGVKSMDYEMLFRTVERGRYNTSMSAYGVNEGGIFTGAQVDSLATVIQFGDWTIVERRVAELGLTPPEVIVVEIPEETLLLVSELPGGDSLASGLNLYVKNCAACHGGNGEGTTLAPALNSDELRVRLDDIDIIRIIEQGVSGTLMAAWNNTLESVEIGDLVTLIRRWNNLEEAGVQMPVIENASIDMSPEAISTGAFLYDILCSQCHGADGYGTPLAPALNNQLFLSETPDAAIQQIVALGVSGTKMPAWGGRLTDADIAAITAYLRSWAPTAPAIVDSAAQTGTNPTVGDGPPWQNNP